VLVGFLLTFDDVKGDWILFTHEGGVDVGDVDAKAEKLLVPVDLKQLVHFRFYMKKKLSLLRRITNILHNADTLQMRPLRPPFSKRFPRGCIMCWSTSLPDYMLSMSIANLRLFAFEREGIEGFTNKPRLQLS